MKKKVLFIIAYKNFSDEEYFLSKNFFERKKFFTKTTSSEKGLAIGLHGGEANVDLTIAEVNEKEFDVIIFIGGSGVLKDINKEDFHKIAKEANKKGVLLGATGIAPIILANAGVLNNKRATVWSSPIQKKTILDLEEKGAIYSSENIVYDKGVITISEAEEIQNFVRKIISILFE